MATSADDIIGTLLAGTGFGKTPGDVTTQNLQNQGLAQQQTVNDQTIALNAAKLTQVQRQAASDANFQADWANYVKNPTTDTLAQLAVKYPTQADALKQYWAIKDPELRQNHIEQIAPVVSLLQNNKPDLAIKHLQGLVDTYGKAGVPTDDYDEMISELQSGDKDAIDSVKATLLMHLAANDKDGKFAESLSKAQKALAGPDGYTLGPNDTRLDGNNNVVARGAPKPVEAFHYTLKDKAGNDHEYIYDPTSGQPLPPGATPAPGASGAGALAPDGHLDPTAFYKQFILPHEGGYSPHDANGAPVNHGINQSANPGVDVKNLSPDDAAQIFAQKYFPPSAGLPPALAAVNADTAFINPARAAQFLKASGGDPTKYMAMRQTWMNSLVATQPDKYAKYAKAWGTRNADLSAYAQNLAGAGGGSGTPAPSGGSPAAGGSRQIDPNPIDNSPGNDATGPAALAAMSPGRASLIKAILDGRAAAPRPGTKVGEQLMEDIARVDPSIDVTTLPMRQKARLAFTGNGPAAQAMSSLNRFAAHMNSAWENHLALGGMNLGPLSGVAASISQSFDPAHVKGYKQELEAIQGEFQKLSKNGAASETEAERLIANAQPAQSQDGRAAALKSMAKLALAQYPQLINQWHSAFPDRPLPVDLQPGAMAALQNIIAGGKSALPVDHNGAPYVPRGRGDQSGSGGPVTATNPITKQRMMLRGNQWVPLQ